MRRALLGVLLPACTGQVQPVRWEPLDLGELERELSSPTAPLTQETLDDLLAAPAGDLSLVDAMLGVARVLLDYTSDGFGSMEENDLGIDLGGTQLYVRVACPGPVVGAPDPEFRHGSMALYSELLSAEVLDTFTAQGDLYVVIRDCQVGAVNASGNMRMYYDVENNRLGVAFEVRFAVDSRKPVFEATVLEEEGQRVRVLYTTDEGETLVVEQARDQPTTAFTVLGRDGAVQCDQMQEPKCPLP